MNKKFILALMLASGMAFAQGGGAGAGSGAGSGQAGQAGSTSGASGQGQGTSSSTTDQPGASNGANVNTDANGQGQNSSATSATSSSDQSNSMRGCLKQSGGNWVLASDNGQSINLQGDSSILKPHDGHQVQVQGTRSSDGSLQVSSVNMISDSCTNNQASGYAPAPAGTSQGILFNYRSTVSLSGNWGEMRAGRDFTPQWRNIAANDPWGQNGASIAVIAPTTSQGLGIVASTTSTAIRSTFCTGTGATQSSRTTARSIRGTRWR